MRKQTMVLAAVLAFAATPVLAQDYVAGRVGEDSSAVAAGVEYGPVRGEVSYTSLSDIGTFNQRARVLSVNGYFTPVTIGPVTPYVTAGVGYGQIRSPNYRDDGLVTNAGVGADWALTDNWSLAGEWRTFFTGDVRERAQGADRPAFNQDTVTVGLKYRF